MSCSQCYQLTSLDRDAPKNGLVLLQSFMCHFSSYLFYIGIFPRKFETLANSQLVFNFFSFRNQGCSHHYFLICYRLRKKDGKESPSQDLIEGWFFNSFFSEILNLSHCSTVILDIGMLKCGMGFYHH